MEKPLTIKRAEFNKALAQTINNAELPAFIVADCLQAVLFEIQNLANQQYQNDLQAYQQANVPECKEVEEVEQNG